MTTLEDLLNAETEETLYTTQLALLEAKSFPVTSWQTTAVPRVMANANARVGSKLAVDIPKIAAGFLLAKSSGAWLDLLVESNYGGLARDAATYTERVFVLADVGGVGPLPVTAGQLVVVDSTGTKRLSNIAGAVIPAGGSVEVTFRAEAGGEGYAGTSTWSFETSLPGVSISEGAITKVGANEESDASLKQRATDKWSSLGAGANDSAYRYHAKQALVGTSFAGQVTRVKVREAYPNPGQVTIYIASDSTSGTDGAEVFPSGPSTLLETVQNYIDPASKLGVAPNCVDAIVTSAKWKKIALVGTVNALAAEKTAAEANAVAALAAYGSATAIGGTVVFEKVIEKIMRQLTDDDRNNLTLTSPAADVVLAADEVPYFDFTGLAWVAV